MKISLQNTKRSNRSCTARTWI